MAKSNVRRSISISGATYERLSAYAKNASLTRSHIVEELITSFLDKKPHALPEPIRFN